VADANAATPAGSNAAKPEVPVVPVPV
jgi:hypothetical protein